MEPKRSLYGYNDAIRAVKGLGLARILQALPSTYIGQAEVCKSLGGLTLVMPITAPCRRRTARPGLDPRPFRRKLIYEWAQMFD